MLNANIMQKCHSAVSYQNAKNSWWQKTNEYYR